MTETGKIQTFHKASKEILSFPLDQLWSQMILLKVILF